MGCTIYVTHGLGTSINWERRMSCPRQYHQYCLRKWKKVLTFECMHSSQSGVYPPFLSRLLLLWNLFLLHLSILLTSQSYELNKRSQFQHERSHLRSYNNTNQAQSSLSNSPSRWAPYVLLHIYKLLQDLEETHGECSMIYEGVYNQLWTCNPSEVSHLFLEHLSNHPVGIFPVQARTWMTFFLICKCRLNMALNPFSRWSRPSVPSRSLAPGNVVDRIEERTSVATY